MRNNGKVEEDQEKDPPPRSPRSDSVVQLLLIFVKRQETVVSLSKFILSVMR